MKNKREQKLKRKIKTRQTEKISREEQVKENVWKINSIINFYSEFSET